MSNGTHTMTLTDFLLARIAEDEEVARRCVSGPPTVMALQVGLDHHEGVESGWVEIDPARVLAECEAKRRIVEMHHVGDPDEWDPELQACRLCQWDEDCDSPKHDYQHGAGRFPCATLRALAAVYADHPDFNPDWRP